MNQPTKDVMREQLALAADEIIALRSVEEMLWNWIDEILAPPKPWWRRWFA